MENNDSNPMENQPAVSSSMYHNEGAAQNATTMNFGNSFNHSGNMCDENSVRAHGNTTPGVSLSNSFQSHPTDRRSIRIGGTAIARVRPNSRGGTVISTNRSNALRLNRIYRPPIDRNFVSVGGHMPEVHQSHNHGESMISNDIMTGEVQSNNSLRSPEQIDGSSLNPGFGINSVSGFQSNVFVEGISNNNDRFIGTQPYYYPHPSDGILGLGGYRDIRYGNVAPYRGFHGYSNVASRPFNSIQAGFLANEQAGLSGAALTPNIMTGISYESVPTQLQQGYLNNASSFPTFSSMDSQLVGTVGSTFGQNQSGHPVPANDASVGQATKDFDQLDEGNQALPAKEDMSYIPRKGKRGRKGAQPAKVILGPSTTIGKPVCVAEEGGLTKASSAPTNLRIPSPKSTPQPSIKPSSPSPAQTNAVYHLKWSGHPVPANDAVAQATKDLDLLDKGKQALPAKEDMLYIPCKGKRGHKGAQPAKGLLGPSSTIDKPIPVAGGGGLTQTSEVHPKTTPPPSIKASSPSPVQANVVYHLKWSGVAGHSSIVENCFLCKRNLRYEPKGPVSEPSIPPAVAVLSCGHTFHDECLELITPKEQSKDPPCIPCAIV